MGRALLVLFLFLGVSAVVSAQTFRGGISGIVTDESGAIVAGADVRATNEATGLGYTTTSSTAGEFTFADLPLGTYTITVATSGFSKVTINSIRVSAGSIYNLPVKLSVAQVATNVEVSAAAVSLETSA